MKHGWNWREKEYDLFVLSFREFNADSSIILFSFWLKIG